MIDALRPHEQPHGARLPQCRLAGARASDLAQPVDAHGYMAVAGVADELAIDDIGEPDEAGDELRRASRW